MRIALACLVIAVANGCSVSQPVPDVDRIEIRRSGWSPLDITVNRRGEGRFHLVDPRPNGRNGSFTVTPQQFERLRERLEPFRRQAVPVTEASIMEILNRGCPEGIAFVTDASDVYIRWISERSDQHYLADFGCDHERNAARNEELRNILKSLPVPVE